MASTSAVLQSFLREMELRNLRAFGDGELLARYLTERDEAAFAALVHRHGTTVLGICRRVLGAHHDAEDAFQVTFLVLVGRASGLVDRPNLAAWLRGVAYHTAQKVRARATRQRLRERARALEPNTPGEEAAGELRESVGRELQA